MSLSTPGVICRLPDILLMMWEAWRGSLTVAIQPDSRDSAESSLASLCCN